MTSNAWKQTSFYCRKHFRKNTLPILKNRYYPIVYHSTYTDAKSRRVSILISAKIPWTHLDAKTDPQGWYLFLKGRIGDVKITPASLYIPNDHQDKFLKHHLEQLTQYSEGQLIIGGDLNIPLTLTEDTSSGLSSTNVRKRISTSLHTAQLIDAWHLFHPGERETTHFTPDHTKHTPGLTISLSHLVTYKQSKIPQWGQSRGKIMPL